MRALVTGGGGFLGSRICALLKEVGHDVLAGGRGQYPGLEALGVPCVSLDVRDPQAVDRACAGRDVVFHAAAATGIWGPRRLFLDTNVLGTRHVLEACRRRGIRQLVYTSSPSVVFGEQDLCGVDEAQPYPARYTACYPESKAAAERAVLEANGPDLRTVALRPHLIWGPGDPHLIPRVIERARSGRLRQVGDGRNLVDVVYIDNAAAAHVLAAEALQRGGRCCGRPYFLSQGAPVALWPWINDLLRRLGIDPVTRRVSYRAAYCAGAALEWTYRLAGRTAEPPMTRFLAGQLAKSHYFNITAARRDLGYEVGVSTADGLSRLVADLQGRAPSSLTS